MGTLRNMSEIDKKHETKRIQYATTDRASVNLGDIAIGEGPNEKDGTSTKRKKKRKKDYAKDILPVPEQAELHNGDDVLESNEKVENVIIEKKKIKKLNTEVGSEKEEVHNDGDGLEHDQADGNDDTEKTALNYCNMENLTISTLKDKICKETLQAIEDMGFTHLTEIQAKAIPAILFGKDVVGSAKTGSGKTMAFLIPAIEILHKNKFTAADGTGCIIISTTRELAAQTYGVLNDLLKDHYLTSSLIMGGEKRSKEARLLATGVNVVVATPGRLLDHMRSRNFCFKKLQCLILDEADKLLEYGFEDDIKAIIKLLPSQRQTMMFSASVTEQTDSLAKFAMTRAVVYIGVDDDKAAATVEGLEQGYVLCPTDERMWWLYKLLQKTKKNKVMVFFSSCKSVEFHYRFFKEHVGARVLCLHGKQEQGMRMWTISRFYDAENGTLFCTDVAARGLDIPAVDWIVQFDPPADSTEYIHRVGRTARGRDGVGHAALLLRPEEADFVEHLKEAKVYLKEFKMWQKYDNMQSALEKLLNEDEDMKLLAREALQGYIRAFEVRRLKLIFNLRTLNMVELAKSFGFSAPPEIDINIGFSKKHRKRKHLPMKT